MSKSNLIKMAQQIKANIESGKSFKLHAMTGHDFKRLMTCISEL